jgi:hypothetical protein
MLNFADLPPSARSARQVRRRSWLGRALPATAGCDLVFADPDNGIRTECLDVSRHRSGAVKFAYLGELAAFAGRGRSLVVYHHADRTMTVEQQARRRLDDLARGVPVEPVAAVRASRGTTRLFLVAATAPHSPCLRQRLTALTDSPWGAELRVYWS